MLTTADTLDIQELADRADVTVRTVRYYIQLGLLPSPEVRGSLTRYAAGHLDRLQLIKLLQRKHLPLSEIRRHLDALDDDAVRRALSQAPEKKPPGSAAAYVRDVLANSARDSSVSHIAAAATDMGLASPEAPYGTREPLHRVESRSTWERITLSRDIELHVRRPLSREQNRQLELLLDAARQLMSEDP